MRVAYFRFANMTQALTIARRFGLTVVDHDGVERLLSDHHGSALIVPVGTGASDGNGDPVVERRLVIQTLTPALDEQLRTDTDPKGPPVDHPRMKAHRFA